MIHAFPRTPSSSGLLHAASHLPRPPLALQRTAQTVSRQELLRTAFTATLDALLPPKRRTADFPLHHLAPLVHSHLTPTHVNPHPSSVLPNDCSLDESSSLSIRWIGHSTMLIRLGGVWILTDPVFSHRIGIEVFGKTIGIDRYSLPAISIEDIPKPDIILLSHAHIDHTELPTLRRFAEWYPDEITVVTAKNTRDVIDGLVWKNVHELDWDEHITVAGVQIRGLEAKHNGWRLPWERDRAAGYTESGRSYNAYLLEYTPPAETLIENGANPTRDTQSTRRIVFGGDTAYTHSFGALKSEGLSVDVAMMPVGAYGGYESLHCTPEQSLQMAHEMEAKAFIPMHCGTFDQSDESPCEPMARLLQAVSLHHTTKLALARIGDCYTLA
jgi:L-ascorbate metabolism protein UlaG (beta-lactamase superfamily)